jgi:hypothetical protein
MTDTPAGSSDNELLWQAKIQDDTQSFFNNFDANVAKTDQAAQAGFSNVATAVAKPNVALSALQGLVAGIAMSLTNMALGAIRDLEGILQESYKVTEAYDKMAASMYIVGQNAGYNSTQMDTYIAALREEGMTSTSAVQSLTKMAQAQLDLSKAQDIAKVAADAGAVSNQSTADAMNEIVRSIQVLAPRLLRTMGIYVDMTKEEKKYADAHNTTVNALDNSTKQQIMMNAILEQGKNIQGAYAASLKTVAGQQQLQAQTTDEINLAIGRLVQPLLLNWLKTANGLLQDFLDWLDKNKTGIETFANDAGNALAVIINAIKSLATTATTGFAGVLTAVSNMTKGIVTNITGNDGADSAIDGFFKRLQDAPGLATAFVQEMSLIIATMSGLFMSLGVGIDVVGFAFKNLFDLAKGNISLAQFNDNMKQLNDILTSTKPYTDAFNNSMKSSVSVMQDVTTVNNDAAAAAAKEANAVKQESDAVDALNQNLTDLQKKLEEDKATAAIKAQRDAMEAEIRDSWARQDMAKSLADNINQIEQNSQDQRVQTVKQYAEQRWQIEHNYQIALKQLQEQFDVDSSEAARKRDAVSLLAIARKNQQDLKNLKDNKDQQDTDAKRNYDKTVNDQKDALAKQIKAANDSYNKQLQQYQQSKDREKVIQDLHDKWAQEDIERATAKQLQTFIDQYNGMDGATQAGLQTVLNDWGTYFTQLNAMIAANAPGINAATGSIPDNNWPSNTSNDAGGKIKNGASLDQGVTGQAGLVTSMLTPYDMRPSALDVASVSRVPTVRPQSDRSGHRSVDVNVAGNALDPYIQRIVVQALLEIERNVA